MREFTVDEICEIAKELLAVLADKKISIRQARWILERTIEMLEDAQLQKPRE